MSILLKPHTIEVTPAFVEYADKMWDIIRNGKRAFTSRPKCDALLYEWFMIRNKYVSPPKNLSHDFIWNGMKIDCKEVNGKHFTVQRNKRQFYVDSVNKKELSHFLFYESSRNFDTILCAGDVVTVTPLYVLPAKTVLKSINSSEFETAEGFVPKSILEMLAESDQ